MHYNSTNRTLRTNFEVFLDMENVNDVCCSLLRRCVSGPSNVLLLQASGVKTPQRDKMMNAINENERLTVSHKTDLGVSSASAREAKSIRIASLALINSPTIFMMHLRTTVSLLIWMATVASTAALFECRSPSDCDFIDIFCRLFRAIQCLLLGQLPPN